MNSSKRKVSKSKSSSPHPKRSKPSRPVRHEDIHPDDEEETRTACDNIPGMDGIDSSPDANDPLYDPMTALQDFHERKASIERINKEKMEKYAPRFFAPSEYIPTPIQKEEVEPQPEAPTKPPTPQRRPSPPRYQLEASEDRPPTPKPESRPSTPKYQPESRPPTPQPEPQPEKQPTPKATPEEELVSMLEAEQTPIVESENIKVLDQQVVQPPQTLELERQFVDLDALESSLKQPTEEFPSVGFVQSVINELNAPHYTRSPKLDSMRKSMASEKKGYTIVLPPEVETFFNIQASKVFDMAAHRALYAEIETVLLKRSEYLDNSGYNSLGELLIAQDYTVDEKLEVLQQKGISKHVSMFVRALLEQDDYIVSFLKVSAICNYFAKKLDNDDLYVSYE